MTNYDIPSYLDYLSPAMLEALNERAEAVAAVPGLRVAPGLRTEFPAIESDAALAFVCELYRAMRARLRGVLEQRRRDRAFVDAVTFSCATRNAGRSADDPSFETVIGRRDTEGRIVVGPRPEGHAGDGRTVSIPPFMAGEQVTLFGPPDTARLSINAMNALHRKLPGEPPLVAELVESAGQVPRWGADDEDSKTPIMRSFLRACENLLGCFDGTLTFEDTARGRRYALADSGLSRPIKRVPGLALPDSAHLLDGNPLPLHLVDLALHLFHAWDRPEALTFYIPKLENEDEAHYLAELITRAESMLSALHPAYQPGTVRVFLVFENPRAIFRIREMADALWPHFLGGSLGWHDFLASTARLFKNDPAYRIPVKADPEIVIKHIRESHQILVESLSPIGAIKIGGMYGVLPEAGDPASLQVSLVGFIKDVTTQLKRGLDGFWVAHPDFVRIGLALVEAWRRYARSEGSDPTLVELVRALVPDPVEHEPLIAFVTGPDVPGLDPQDPRYLRAVLAAELAGQSFIANDDPEEVRYNIFQALQYLADWLCGNGCVALPATMTDVRGETIFVRVMDDLATTERSRWEVWAEIHHGRVSRETFERLLQEELDFIREDRSTPTRRVAVRYAGEAARWYPVAAKVLRQLMTDPHPVEFATELLLPFTLDFVRNSDDPWGAAAALAPGRYR